MNIPLVSCVMVTYNRRKFIPQAIKYFLRQDYPKRELIILDDGTDPVQDLIPEDKRIRYFRVLKKWSIGTKRNIGCSLVNGKIIIWWDDDDWYADHRISYQVAPLLKHRTDITALTNSLMFDTENKQFWSCATWLHEKMWVYGVLGGTAAFRTSLWKKGRHLPDCSLAEEAAFLKEAVHSGARLKKLKNDDVFIYWRHNFNSWNFIAGEHVDKNGWKKVDPPQFLSDSDRNYFGI